MAASARPPFPLNPGEEILLCVRRHWIAVLPRFLLLLITAAVPAGFALGLLMRLGVSGALPWRLGLAAAAVWAGFWFARALLLKRRHERMVSCVTSQRLVTVQAERPFTFVTSSRSLDDVREVQTRVTGPLGTLLHFGDVRYGRDEGARAGTSTVMRCVARPHDVALLIERTARATRGAHPNASDGGRTTVLDREQVPTTQRVEN